MSPVDRATLEGLAWWAAYILVPLAIWRAADGIGRRLRKRREDRERAAAVARRFREDDFTAYADEVIEGIFREVLDESVYDQEADE